MNKQDRRNRRKVRRCARPIDIRNGSRRAVLCLHGFTGYPGEMAYPASRLAEAGWDVRVPRLSGHGTDGADWADTRISDITRQIRDEWLNLSSAYDKVCLIGHSMGGLLALNLAREYPVPRLAVMAPAIGLRAPGQFLLRPISMFVKKRPIDWKPDKRYTFFDDRDEDDDEYLGGEYWSWAWLRHMAQLQRVMLRTEKRLGRIQSPVFGVFGSKDDLVGQRGQLILEQGLGGEFRALQLKESGHYIPYEFNPGVKEAAMDAVVDWFDEN